MDGRTVGFEIDLDAVKSIDSINSTKRITQSRSTYFYVDTKLMIEQLLDSTMAGPPPHIMRGPVDGQYIDDEVTLRCLEENMHFDFYDIKSGLVKNQIGRNGRDLN